MARGAPTLGVESLLLRNLRGLRDALRRVRLGGGPADPHRHPGCVVRIGTGIPMIHRPTSFEMAALEAALAGEHPALNALRAQLDGLSVDKREFTGVGFFLNLRVNHTGIVEPLRIPHRLVVSDVEASIGGLAAGAGIALFVVNGVLELLEGFTYAEPWPSVVESYSFRYRDPFRAELHGLLAGEVQ